LLSQSAKVRRSQSWSVQSCFDVAPILATMTLESSPIQGVDRLADSFGLLARAERRAIFRSP
jgi:hypothetical protein